MKHEVAGPRRTDRVDDEPRGVAGRPCQIPLIVRVEDEDARWIAGPGRWRCRPGGLRRHLLAPTRGRTRSSPVGARPHWPLQEVDVLAAAVRACDQGRASQSYWSTTSHPLTETR